MASVTQIHSLDSVKISRSPFDIAADKVDIIMRSGGTAVSFNIRFINDIKTVDVAEREELSVGRIVRGSDGVDIERFHKFYVFFKIRKAHDIACFVLAVMVVNALELDFFAVDREYILFDFNRLEADIIANSHYLLFAFIKGEKCRVERRNFSVPCGNIKSAEFNFGICRSIGSLRSNQLVFAAVYLCAESITFGFALNSGTDVKIPAL